ncbi:hypothetical protein SAMN04487764_2709 [Gillisia sp. Hel1_33_143]|nr:hypothetical protein SAMN04487764_2709 [Gillisia sp. Hel1_33_143]
MILFQQIIPKENIMIWKTTLSLLFLLPSFFALSAQNIKAYEITEYLAQNSNKKTSVSTMKTKSSAQAAVPLQVLAYDLVPTVFIESNEINAYDEKSPIKAEVDFKSFSKLLKANSLFEKVELLVIKFDDAASLPSTIDFSKISGFSSLKYIYIICPFNCSNTEIEKIAMELPSGVVLLYSTSIPQ